MQVKLFFHYIFWLFLICFNQKCFSQSALDGLQQKLSIAHSIKEKVLLQTSIADKLPAAKVDSAISYCYAALKLSKEINNDSLQGVCYRCLVYAYNNKSYFEDSALYFIPFFKKHVEEKSFYELEYAGYLAIADVYLKKHEYPEATVYYQLAMQMAEKTKKPVIVGWAKYKLSDMYRKSENYADAIKLCYELVEEGKKHKLHVNTYNGYRGIAICFDMQHQYDSAEKYFSLALETAKETKQKSRIAAGYSLVGVAQWHLKKYADAIVSMHQAKELYKSMDTEQIIPVLQNLCSVFRDMNKPDSAEIYCKLGLEEATKRNQQLSISQLHGFLSDVYKKKGEYKLAWEHLAKKNYFDDSLNTVVRTKAVSELEEKYKNKENQSRIDLLNKEKDLQSFRLKQQASSLYNTELESENRKGEIELLNKTKQLQEAELSKIQSDLKQKALDAKAKDAEIKNQKLIRNTLFAGTIFLLLLGFLLFNRFQLKKKVEQQQAIINERQRISRDLHDDLGAQLSTAKMFLSSIKNNPDLGKNNVMLETSLNLIDTTIGDLKKIMDDLQSSVLQDKGYIAATEELVSKIVPILL